MARRKQARVAEEPAVGTATAEPQVGSSPLSLDDPSLYLNRELSLLSFQARVLEEARDSATPLLERVKFLSILGSNLDEFFMVRVAGVVKQVDSGLAQTGPEGWAPAALLKEIRRRVGHLMDEAYRCLLTELLPELAQADLHVLDYGALSAEERATADAYFRESVFPVLTPLAVDSGRPFPHISNLSLNLGVLVRDTLGVVRFARVKIPDTLPQLVAVRKPAGNGRPGVTPTKQVFVWLEQIVAANLQVLFPGVEVLESHPFHITRDAEVAIQELEADDLLETIEEGVRQRRFGDVVRLQVAEEMPERVLTVLTANLEPEADAVYRVRGPLGLVRMRHLAGIDRPALKDRPLVPCVPAVLQEEDVFAAIRSGDVLLHHPFDSFQPVVDLLRKAARDPDVLAIKMTLYRVGRNSPIVEALLEAMEEGKQVAVLVELKARFDEESNIEWARALEREGVHVVYGLVGLKIHSKVAMVVRREGETIRRYVHLGTGNYNAVTAHLYTDFGLLTCDEGIAADVTDLFNYLTGYSAKAEYQKLLVAPIQMRERLEELIQREVASHQSAGGGRLIFKMNALEDERMIQLLYRASQAGVRVDLLVRGLCCLRPGVPGVSDNIRVISIVGRLLEHSRVFYFRNGGQDEIYLGSADLMPRNLNRRVEVVFPVRDERLVSRLRDQVLETYLTDEANARVMRSDGTYQRVRPHRDGLGLDAHLQLAKGR